MVLDINSFRLPLFYICVFNIKGFILLKNREKREVIFMAGVITVERESVCMGDDLNAPNTTTVSINDEIL